MTGNGNLHLDMNDLRTVPDFPGLLRVDGRSFVVAGTGDGIGRQIAHALAQSGARRILCVDVEEERARAVASEIGVGVAWVGDITKRAEVQRLTSDVRAQLGRVDGLVDIVGGQCRETTCSASTMSSSPSKCC